MAGRGIEIRPPAPVSCWAAPSRAPAFIVSEIGLILGIQLTTVRQHPEGTFMQLGVENRTAAVTLALGRSTPQG